MHNPDSIFHETETQLLITYRENGHKKYKWMLKEEQNERGGATFVTFQDTDFKVQVFTFGLTNNFFNYFSWVSSPKVHFFNYFQKSE